ncbi:hypothetical protein E4U41_000703 [Claviceps citrina]|nr:hypothetical protein E4U41_000703 [Claviceps citrina]
MLLPSALSCDAAQALRPVLQPTSYFSPPSSPPTPSSATALGNIMTTCRSLQALIAPPAPSSQFPHDVSSRLQLPSPPKAHVPLPMKLRLRTRHDLSDSSINNKDLHIRRKIVKRSIILPGGINKRRCVDGDELGGEDLSSGEEVDSAADLGATYQQSQSSSPGGQAACELSICPSTPKRARIAPEQLPLGLERSDYHDLNSNAEPASDGSIRGEDVYVEAGGNEWSAEDDRLLVELVLGKLKLSKSEWQDCARNLGKDRHSVNRRWKSLLMKGEVGVKTRLSSRRNRLCSTWR